MNSDNLPTMGEEAEMSLAEAQEHSRVEEMLEDMPTKATEPEWLTRLKAEHHELNERGQKLDKFIKSNPGFAKLPDRDKALLALQLRLMADLFGILNERIFRAVNPELAARADAQDAEYLKAEREKQDREFGQPHHGHGGLNGTEANQH